MRELKLSVPGRGEVSAILLRPESAQALLVLAHGAGAGMRHPFMEGFSRMLAQQRLATLRFQFLYSEAKQRRPDPAPVLQQTILAAIHRAAELGEGLPLFAGGKSMGGRMTSLLAARKELAGVRGLVLVGFPLHPVGQPGTERAQHLNDVELPMLFLQGTRDKLAERGLIEPLVRGLGARAQLHILDGGDHSFRVPKSTGRTDSDVVGELATVVGRWIGERLEPTGR